MTRPFVATPARATRAGMRRAGLALALLVGACAGGSGSSGFGTALRAENAAIDVVIATRGCSAVSADGITVCAADGIGAPPIGTPAPTPGMDNAMVDTNLDGLEFGCDAVTASGQCVVRVMFAPFGFPPSARFRVAVRDRAPDGPWRLAPAPAENGTPDNPSFDVAVVVDGAAPDANGGAVQMAVLVFLLPPGPLPEVVTTLGETGADFAFVTQPLTPSF